MTDRPSPHSRFEHLFVVLRVDDFSVADRIEDRFSLVSAYRSQAEAEEEAERLNRLAEAKNCHYSVVVTRLKEGAGPPSSPSSSRPNS